MSAPPRVVAVVNTKAVAGYPYLCAVVYQLAARKRDGVLTYRRDGVNYCRPHRSERLAVLDAEGLADRLKIPFWRHVRHGMTEEEATQRAKEGS